MIRYLINIILYLIFFTTSQLLFSQNKVPFYNLKNTYWVDSLYKNLTLKDKVGQLFMIRVNPNWNEQQIQNTIALIKKYNIGGIVLFKGDIEKTAELINRLQEAAKIPLLIAIDGETGLGMRLNNSISFPYQMTLGSIKNDSLIYLMAKEIGRQLKRIGIHINFAPVADINSNYQNPIIGMRSFGQSKNDVAKKCVMYASGLQECNIIAVAKHFPGHGNTNVDSHHDLPVITSNFEQLDSIELIPFKTLIQYGITGIMNAHLAIPAIDTSNSLPSSLSYNNVTKLLKQKLNYQGLIFTDGLDMKGVTKFFKNGKAELQAIKAGNDILLLPENIPSSFDKITRAIDSLLIDSNSINLSCKKILMAKYWVGLNNYKPTNLKNIVTDINTPYSQCIIRAITQEAITLLKNVNAIPLNSYRKNISINIGSTENTINTFQKTLFDYDSIAIFSLQKNNIDPELKNTLLEQVTSNKTVILSISNTNMFPVTKYGISQNTIDLVDTILLKNNNVIFILFGPPYALNLFRNIARAKAIIITYEDNDLIQEITAGMIYGTNNFSSSIPVTIDKFSINTGLKTNNKYNYSLNKNIYYQGNVENSINNTCIKHIKEFKIDSLINLGLKENLYNTCNVLISLNNNIIYNKIITSNNYIDSSLQNIDYHALFDIGGITNIASTTLAIMKLYENNLIDIDKPLKYYLPQLTETNKANITIKEILSHTSRIKEWIPFHKQIIKGDWFDDGIMSKEYSEQYSIIVHDSLFLNKDFLKTIEKQINESHLYKRKTHLYSNISFYYLKLIIEKITNTTLDKYVYENIYKPLGLVYISYKPLDYLIDLSPTIIPSQIDNYFRKITLKGHVNDEFAALQGGVAAHAGLFANAYSLAVIMQMLLNNGEYRGIQLFKPSTVKLFTTPYIENGLNLTLGFDNIFTSSTKHFPLSPKFSQNSFGHTSYSGCVVWADKENNMIFIFLSNRLYPSPDIKRFNKFSLPQKIYDEAYNIIFNEN